MRRGGRACARARSGSAAACARRGRLSASALAPVRRARVVARAARGGDGDADGEDGKADGEEEKQAPDETPIVGRLRRPNGAWNLWGAMSGNVFELLTLYGGITGTAAVVVGAAVNINPLQYMDLTGGGGAAGSMLGSFGAGPGSSAGGPLEDAVVGIYAGFPVYVCDALLMLPPWPRMATGAAPNSGAARAGAGRGALEPYLSAMEAAAADVRQKLAYCQVRKLQENPGRGLSLAGEMTVIACAHLADEMLHRGLILVGLRMLLLNQFRDFIWDKGIEESTIEAFIFRTLDFLPASLKTVDNLAGLVAVTLVVVFSVLISSTRLFLAQNQMSRQRDAIDSIMIRNIYRFSLCPMIWASLSADERNALRSLAGEPRKEGEAAASEAPEAPEAPGAGVEPAAAARPPAADGGMMTDDETNLAKQALKEMIKDRPSQRVYELLTKKCEEAAAAQSQGVAESGAGRILRSGRNFTASLETSRFVFEGFRDVVEVVCFSSAFLLTGNLLASYSSSVVADVLFSSYQRGVGRRDVAYSAWKSNMQFRGMEIMLEEPLAMIRADLEEQRRAEPPPPSGAVEGVERGDPAAERQVDEVARK